MSTSREIRCENIVGANPKFPDKCPVCSSDAVNLWDGTYKESQDDSHYRTGPQYSCGSRFAWKNQIQNHHNVWWLFCDSQKIKKLKKSLNFNALGW